MYLTRYLQFVPCSYRQVVAAINYTVIRNIQYLRNLVQGSLEIPCELKFTGDDKHIEKVDKLIKASLAIKEDSVKEMIKTKETHRLLLLGVQYCMQII